MIPIIIFHIGNQPYVHHCLNTTLRHNNTIHLLSDNPDNFDKRDNLYVENYTNYSINSSKFQSLYKHFSTNSFQLEFICIIRWLCIYEYMEKQNIEKAFICDSDIFIYDDISNIVDKYLPNDMYLCSSVSKSLTGGQSVFTLSKIKQFVQFIFRFYETQIPNITEWKETYNEAGGVCDMTLLYYFAHGATEFVGLRLPDYPYFENDLTKIFDNEFTFDLHMGIRGNHIYPDDYEMEGTHKKIKMIDGTPYCFNNRLNKDIRFVLLHFQGRHKNLMDTGTYN